MLYADGYETDVKHEASALFLTSLNLMPSHLPECQPKYYRHPCSSDLASEGLGIELAGLELADLN